MDPYYTRRLVTVALICSVMASGLCLVSLTKAESGVPGMVVISPDVTIRQGNGVNWSFADRAVISKLELSSTAIEINDNFLIGATTSSGYLSNELANYDPNYNIRWIGTCTVEDATVSYTLGGLSSQTHYDIIVDGSKATMLSTSVSGGFTYTYLGTWSTHEFVIQKADTPSIGVMAAFKYHLEGGTAYFTDLSYNGPTVWVWNFGDGFGSTSQSPTHKYTRAGVYHVTLTVYDAEARSSQATTTIELVLGEDYPIERTDKGWNVYLADGYVVGISAMGCIFGGAFLFLTGRFLKDMPILTSKGRMGIGILLILVGVVYFIFVDNSWMNFDV
jgi:PKD repeat protein